MLFRVGKLMGSRPSVADPSPSSPSPPLTNLIQWLDASVDVYQDTGFTTPATATNDPVLGWKDQSGLGHHATSAQTPLLKLSGLNGKSTIVSNKDFYTFTQIDLGSSFAAFLVVKTGTTADNFTVGYSRNTNVGGNFLGLPSPGTDLFYLNNTGVDSVTASVADSTVFNLVEIGSDGSNMFAAFNNGVLQSAESSQTTSFLGLGAWPFTNSVFIGEFAESLMYSPRPSSGDLILIKEYLNTKYALY